MLRFSIYSKISVMTLFNNSSSADESLNLEKSIKYCGGKSASTCQIRKMITRCNVLLYVEYSPQVRRRYSGSFSTRTKYISYNVLHWHDKYPRIFQYLNDREGVLYHKDKLRWDHLSGKRNIIYVCDSYYLVFTLDHPPWDYWSHPETLAPVEFTYL